MPSKKVLEAKKQEVAALSDRIQNSCAGVLVSYSGVTVADDTTMRSDLRKAGVEYSVSKNTMIRLAVKGTELEGVSDVLSGTTAIATSKDDYVAAAKILCKFASKHEGFQVKSGYIDKEVISVDKILNLSKLPSREVLLATVCNVFNAPIAAFARAVQAIVDKAGEPAAEAAAE